MENYQNKPVVSTEELMADSKQSYPYEHPMMTNNYPPTNWRVNRMMAIQYELLWQRFNYQSFYDAHPKDYAPCENATLPMDTENAHERIIETASPIANLTGKFSGDSPKLVIEQDNFDEMASQLELVRKHKRKVSADILALIDARSENHCDARIEEEPELEMDTQPDADTPPNIDMDIDMEDDTQISQVSNVKTELEIEDDTESSQVTSVKTEFQPETGVMEDVKRVLDLELINTEENSSLSTEDRIANRVTISQQMLDKFLSHGNPNMARKYAKGSSKDSEQRKKNNLSSRISRAKTMIANGLVEVKTHNLCLRKKEIKEWIKRLSKES